MGIGTCVHSYIWRSLRYVGEFACGKVGTNDFWASSKALFKSFLRLRSSPNCSCTNNTFKFEYCKVYIDPTPRNAHFCSATRCINVNVCHIIECIFSKYMPLLRGKQATNRARVFAAICGIMAPKKQGETSVQDKKPSGAQSIIQNILEAFRVGFSHPAWVHLPNFELAK